MAGLRAAWRWRAASARPAAATRWPGAARSCRLHRSVGIPPLENRTTFFQVEQVLTEKIRTEFIGRGKYEVVPRNRAPTRC